MPSRLYTLTYRVDTTQAMAALDGMEKKLIQVAGAATSVAAAAVVVRAMVPCCWPGPYPAGAW